VGAASQISGSRPPSNLKRFIQHISKFLSVASTKYSKEEFAVMLSDSGMIEHKYTLSFKTIFVDAARMPVGQSGDSHFKINGVQVGAELRMMCLVPGDLQRIIAAQASTIAVQETALAACQEALAAMQDELKAKVQSANDLVAAVRAASDAGGGAVERLLPNVGSFYTRTKDACSVCGSSDAFAFTALPVTEKPEWAHRAHSCSHSCRRAPGTSWIGADGSAAPETGAIGRPVKNKIVRTLRARGVGGGWGGRDAPVHDWGDTPARASGRGRGSGRDMTDRDCWVIFLI
jgi:hypothetical protein